MGGSQKLSRFSGKEKTSLPLLGIKPRLSSLYLVTILTNLTWRESKEIPLLLSLQETNFKVYPPPYIFNDIQAKILKNISPFALFDSTSCCSPIKAVLSP